MRAIVLLILSVVIIWFIAATFDFGEERTVYSARKTPLPLNGKPSLLAHNPSTYKLRGDQIVHKVLWFVDEYDDCEIYSIDDWTCNFPDGSATFGFRYGSYWHRSKLGKDYHDTHYLSPLEYHILRCRWDWLDGPIQMLACFLRPFS